jgi:nucleotide-binding universal stress UspA family protein
MYCQACSDVGRDIAPLFQGAVSDGLPVRPHFRPKAGGAEIPLSPIDPDPLSRPTLGSVFHPSDFSDASDVAFAHALRIALATRARLNMLHVAADDDAGLDDFPLVRATLARWGVLPKDSPPSAVAGLGIAVSKVVTPNNDPVRASLDYLETHPADLIVLAVHQYEGRTRWLKERVGEPIAREAGEMTLFVPHGVRGFVSGEGDSLTLRKILVPIARKPRGEPAIEAAALMVRSLELPSGTFHILHVGPSADAPRMPWESPAPGWGVERLTIDGEPSEVILEQAAELGADLIVMTTEGPHGFLDALRGSTSERVLRKTPCPVMSLPAQAWSSRMRRFWAG